MSVLIDDHLRRDMTIIQNRHDYTYPYGLDLQPDAEQHTKLSQNIMRRALNSHSMMKRRHGSWDEIDRTLTAYIPTDTKEQDVLERDPRKPVSIVFPITYTVLMTLLTHWTLSRRGKVPRYEGQAPEDHVGSILLEKVNGLHMRRCKGEERLYYMRRDALAYGLGGVSCIWERNIETRTGVEDMGFYSAAGGEPFFWPTGKQKTVKEVVCEGNKLVTIDPRRYLPDPNVPVHEVQSGEYAGWVERTNIMRLKALERQGELFNVKYVEQMGQGRSTLIPIDDNARDRDGLRNENISDDTRPVDVIWMYCRIIPKEWKLGAGEDPEMWLLAVAGDLIVIQAERMDANHGKIPIAVSAPNADGHSISPVSSLETTYGMQKVADFEINSHVASQRKLIKNLLVFDPSQINSEDMKAGKSMVRARKRAFGTPLKDAIFQVPMNDVTQANMANLAQLVDMIQKTSGASMLEGDMRGLPERPTAEGLQGANRNALSRIELIAYLSMLQAEDDITYFFAEHTQQYMSQQAWVDATGEWAQVLQMQYGPMRKIPVSPMDIVIDYDILTSYDGIMGGENVDAAVQTFQLAATNPMLSMNFDVVRLFSNLARMAGFKNIDDYRLNTGGMMPNAQPVVAGMEQIQGQVDAGNLMPVPQQGAVA